MFTLTTLTLPEAVFSPLFTSIFWFSTVCSDLSLENKHTEAVAQCPVLSCASLSQAKSCPCAGDRGQAGIQLADLGYPRALFQGQIQHFSSNLGMRCTVWVMLTVTISLEMSGE